MTERLGMRKTTPDTAWGGSHQSQVRRLCLLFVAWKALLILLAALCPGPGYDTSGLILLVDDENRDSWFSSSSVFERVALNHLRWDALYFVKAAQRGYLYEQEWAFSQSYSAVLRAITNYLMGTENRPLEYFVWAGIGISNVCHLISVLVLYRLAKTVLGPQHNPRVPFVASILHIISPAGLFLSAPYAESLFSAANFTGMLHYVLARRTAATAGKWTVTQDSYMLSAGVFFAVATLIRSNGLLSGLIFLYDVACYVPRIFALQLKIHDARRLFVTCVAGVILACGFIMPQIFAYQEYCGASSHDAGERPWCGRTMPSIYSWVQSHYWNVGFLRYWNMSNLPLFLIAAPMLWLLCKTSATVLQELRYRPAQEKSVHESALGAEAPFCGFPQLAIPQLVLAVAATTNFHVQIINRISSGYPIWYLVVAKWVVDQAVTPKSVKANMYSQWAIRGMVMYAIIQALLFAGFLPPA